MGRGKQRAQKIYKRAPLSRSQKGVKVGKVFLSLCLVVSSSAAHGFAYQLKMNTLRTAQATWLPIKSLHPLLGVSLYAPWRKGLAEDMDYHDQSRPGNDLQTASLRPRTMEKGLDESVS